MAFRQHANSANPATTLASNYTSGGATLSVNSVANFPANVQYIIGVVTSGTTEWFLVTGVSGTNLTVTGAQEGSSAANHSSGDSVYLVLTSGTLAQLLTETNNYGTYANRPTSATGARTGMTYKCSDSPYEYVFDGTLWQPRVAGFQVVEPVLANFTQVNVGLSTFDSTHGGLIWTAPANGSVINNQILAQAIPGSGAYYVDCAFMGFAVHGAQSGICCGVSAGTLTSSAYAITNWGYDGALWQVLSRLYNSTTSFNANRNISTADPVGPLLWLRCYDDRTTNRTFYFSINGYTWYQIYQEARTTLFAPSQGILCLVSYAAYIQAHFVHFSIHA